MYLQERNTQNHLTKLQILLCYSVGHILSAASYPDSSFPLKSGQQTSDPFEGSVWKSKHIRPADLQLNCVRLAHKQWLS